MKRGMLTIAILWICSLLSTLAAAADYPSSRIAADLEKARTPVIVDLSDLAPGGLRAVEYASDEVWIYRRTKADIEYLRAAQHAHLANPNSAGFLEVIEDQYWSSTAEPLVRLLMVTQPQIEKTPFRSANENFLVIRSSGPLGCALKKMPADLRPMPAAPFLDVCAGTWFDVAGRVLKSDWTPPPSRTKALAGGNLLIPPHHFRAPTRLVIGLAPSETIPEIDSVALRSRVYARLSPEDRLSHAAAYNDIEEIRRGLRNGVPAQPALNTWPCPSDPLDGAIVGGSMEIIELMLERGARPTTNSFEVVELVQRPAVEALLKEYEIKPRTCVSALGEVLD
jgi:ubiquinol-cytochrome c reductase iron-sulfur subunit